MRILPSILSVHGDVFNDSQGSYPRVLFVCSVGQIRSATAMHVAFRYGLNSRCCGSKVTASLVPISGTLVEWARVIVFMTKENLNEAIDIFKDDLYIMENLSAKSIVWNIHDIYNYMDKELVELIDKNIENNLPIHWRT